MSFAAGTSASAYLWLFALVRLGCGQDFLNGSTPGLSFRPFDGPSCTVPPPRRNGQLWLHAYFCNDRSADCNVPEGTKLGLGYQLIHKCTIGGVIGNDRVYCKPSGKWTKIPKCRTSVGVSYNGWQASPSDFPWHATLYKEKKSPAGTIKTFICGATIIQANFVITAAHCVYDEATATTEDAGKLYLMAGNEYRDYDHPPRRDERSVQKTAVKKVHLPFDYYGLRGNYGSDIALLELQTLFTASRAVSPVNWDAFKPDAPILQKDAIGKVCGFGRTETLDSSPTLQAITAPYVPYSECQPPADSADNFVFITRDKFCAGYTNGTVVCDGDSGGGLVFENNQKRYIMGIVSISLGVDLSNGERKCAKHALTLYTKVSEYTDWIREVISDPKQSEQSLSSISNRTSSSPISAGLISPLTLARSSFCVSPEQPINGQWELHPQECIGPAKSTNCRVAAGVELEAGTTLFYTCDRGYEASGSVTVYCTRSGSWSHLPECINSSPSTNRQPPVVQDGAQEGASEFPWQASVYVKKNTPKGIVKQFQCAATIIKANLLMIRSYCTLDEETNTALDREKLFVIAGNIYPDYDSPLHDLNVVRKSRVEVIYRMCSYHNKLDDYHEQGISLLQLEQPLQFTDNHSQPLPEVEEYSLALRDLKDRNNVFIFRTTRGSVICYDDATHMSFRQGGNMLWYHWEIARPSD